jgi:hypothetical protein
MVLLLVMVLAVNVYFDGSNASATRIMVVNDDTFLWLVGRRAKKVRSILYQNLRAPSPKLFDGALWARSVARPDPRLP